VASWMVTQNLVHRDYKADNIIINPDTLIVKVIDFGLATEIQSEAEFVETHLGTPLYMAPEVLHKWPLFQVSRADVWSIGICFVEMLLGAHPFVLIRDFNELKTQQKSGVEVSKFTPLVAVIIKSLLEYDSNSRVTLTGAFKLIEEYYVAKKAQEIRENSNSDSDDNMELDKNGFGRQNSNTTEETTESSSPHCSSALEERYLKYNNRPLITPLNFVALEPGAPSSPRPHSPLPKGRMRAYSHSKTKSWDLPGSPKIPVKL